MTRLTKISILTRRENTMELPVDSRRIHAWYAARERDPQRAPLIQDAFPELNDDQREFMLTGATPEEWSAFSSKMQKH
jgi:hypothetical protein